MKANYSEEFAKKIFSANNMKDAYLKAVKWYSSNIISKDELSKGITCSFEKDYTNKQSPSIILHLYANIELDVVEKRHCDICKETHSSFYMNSEYNCDRCNMKAYQRRQDKSLKTKLMFYKNKLIDVL
jgi:hypothetical protein